MRNMALVVAGKKASLFPPSSEDEDLLIRSSKKIKNGGNHCMDEDWPSLGAKVNHQGVADVWKVVKKPSRKKQGDKDKQPGSSLPPANGSRFDILAVEKEGVNGVNLVVNEGMSSGAELAEGAGILVAQSLSIGAKSGKEKKKGAVHKTNTKNLSSAKKGSSKSGSDKGESTDGIDNDVGNVWEPGMLGQELFMDVSQDLDSLGNPLGPMGKFWAREDGLDPDDEIVGETPADLCGVDIGPQAHCS
ncbi:hypothetical protein K1719_015910 [Acacia pycnantha]|nr:hypothetical protein K1719_015910 [Acacia pycnantha]